MSLSVMLVVVWAALLVNLLLTLRLARQVRLLVEAREAPPPVPGVAVGEPAPAFVAETIEGHQVQAADSARRSLLLIYLSHQCPTCRSHLPTLGRIHALAQRAGSDVLVAVFDDRSDVAAATAATVAEHRITANVAIVGPGHPLERVYNPNRASPFFYLIEGGVVRAKGALGTAEWERVMQGWQAAAEQERSQLARFT